LVKRRLFASRLEMTLKTMEHLGNERRNGKARDQKVSASDTKNWGAAGVHGLFHFKARFRARALLADRLKLKEATRCAKNRRD